MTLQGAGILLPVLSRKSSAEQAAVALADYRKYIESVRANLPLSACSFALASWHYDYTDHRCPHDSWMESIAVSEPASGARHEVREIGIVLRLLGAHHDGYLELSYPGVRSYSASVKSGSTKNSGHGDWLTDEVSLSKDKLVIHEILFSSGSRWFIESRDIHFRWIQR